MDFTKTNSAMRRLVECTPARSVHFSSATGEWETPQVLFDQLDWIYGGFTLDPCATAESAKCPRFYTRSDDGLSQPWTGKVFMNPPYGRQIWRVGQEGLGGISEGRTRGLSGACQSRYAMVE
jgi:phage N-6-adenine-methyltransferase